MGKTKQTPEKTGGRLPTVSGGGRSPTARQASQRLAISAATASSQPPIEKEDPWSDESDGDVASFFHDDDESIDDDYWSAAEMTGDSVDEDDRDAFFGALKARSSRSAGKLSRSDEEKPAKDTDGVDASRNDDNTNAEASSDEEIDEQIVDDDDDDDEDDDVLLNFQYLIDETLHPENNPAMRDDENPQHALDFASVPYRVESLISFGLSICFESLLFTLAVLPLRCALSLYALVHNRINGGAFELRHIQKIDVLRFALVLLGFLFVKGFPLTVLASFIQRETLLKLKIMLTLLELMDRLLCSYGENVLGSLYWAIEAPRERVPHGFVYHFSLSIAYICIHSLFLLLNLSVFEVAVNSKNSTLVTLLILVQFAEMKSGVMKTLSNKGVQKMVGNDIVERFQLAVYMLLLVLYNNNPEHPVNEQFYFAIAVVYGSEIMVDWLKHSSIINYNAELSPLLYRDTMEFFAQRFAPWPARSFLTDVTCCLNPELGLLPLGLAVIVLKVLYEFGPRHFAVNYALLVLLGCAARWLNLAILRVVSAYLVQAKRDRLPTNASDKNVDAATAQQAVAPPQPATPVHSRTSSTILPSPSAVKLSRSQKKVN